MWSHLIPLQLLIMTTTINKTPESFWHTALEMRSSQTGTIVMKLEMENHSWVSIPLVLKQITVVFLLTPLSSEYTITDNTVLHTGKKRT